MRQYIVDAFTKEVFHGNQAAVCVLEGGWLDEELMDNITRENNYSETAFTYKDGDIYHIRWLTPGGEIDLCGHATLATAYILFNYYETEAQQIVFTSMSGELVVNRKGDMYELMFPAYDLKPVEVTDLMEEVTGTRPVEAYMGRDLLCVYEDEDTVRNMEPDFAKMLELDGLLLHVTAKGAETDSVSRSFAPKLKVNEDPVCGSGHCHIVPYWTAKEGKDEIVAYQASPRGGYLYARKDGDKVYLAGYAALYAVDELNV